jgi:hypothetical protein
LFSLVIVGTVYTSFAERAVSFAEAGAKIGVVLDASI